VCPIRGPSLGVTEQHIHTVRVVRHLQCGDDVGMVRDAKRLDVSDGDVTQVHDVALHGVAPADARQELGRRLLGCERPVKPLRHMRAGAPRREQRQIRLGDGLEAQAPASLLHETD